MSSEQVKTGNSGKIIVGVVIAGLLSAVVFLFIQNRNLSANVTESTDDITQLTTEITDLEKEIEDYKVEIENKDLTLEEKEAEIAEKEKQLLDKQKRIDQLIASGKLGTAKAEELKNKVAQLQYYLGEQQKEIERLKTEVTQLQGTVDTLHGTITKISDEKDKIDDERRRLGLKVKAAAILKASEFVFFEVKESGKETQESEFKAGRIEKIRMNFKTLENVAAEKGSKTFYVTLLDPKGNEIKDASGSGYFPFEETNKVFTLKDSWGFDGTTQTHSLVFKRPASYTFTKGTHTVIVYCEDFEIGSGKFNVK